MSLTLYWMIITREQQNSWSCTSNEEFRQLEDISDGSEHFPHQVKPQLLQNAISPINDLRMVETLDEFQSITSGY